MERRPTKWEKIFINEVTDKGLILKIHKHLSQLYIKKKTIQIKKWAEDLNRHLFKEDRWMAKKHMKRCSTPLFIRENQNYNEVSPLTSQNSHDQNGLHRGVPTVAQQVKNPTMSPSGCRFNPWVCSVG